MKLVSKESTFIPKQPIGVYPNAFIKDTRKDQDSNESMRIRFNLYYVVDGVEYKSNELSIIRLNERHTPTYVVVDGKQIEILSFVESGGVITDETEIIFGNPSVEVARNYFKPESVNGSLEIADTPLKSVVQRWVLDSVYIGGEKASENFKFED